MASKDEYYQRIIASLQADISSQNKAILDLKTTVDRQQKEIEAIKASQDTPQISSEHPQERISTEHLLLAVKRVCDDAIRVNYEQLPTMFTDRQQFENFRKSSEQKFLSVETFTDYKKSLEVRLKTIEEKLGQGFCFLAINLYDHKRDNRYKSILSGLRSLKDIEVEGLLPFLVFLFLGMLAIYLISTISD